MTLGRYTPELDADVWAEIGPFVRDAAIAAAPLTAYTAHRLAVVLSGFVAWAWNVEGLELSVRPMFRRTLILRYIDYRARTGDLAEGTLRNYRSMLLRVQETLAPEQGVERGRALNARTSMPPYTEADVRRIVTWTRGQNTEIKTRKAMAMASLCLGAGLHAVEVVTLRRCDVERLDGCVVVRAAGREVPVLAAWETMLTEVVAPLSSDDLVFGAPTRRTTRNVLSGFVASSSGTFRPRSDRMRATWIVHHLRAGTPIKELTRAAGITKFENLARYLEYVPDLDSREYRHRLRQAVRG